MRTSKTGLDFKLFQIQTNVATINSLPTFTTTEARDLAGRALEGQLRLETRHLLISHSL